MKYCFLLLAALLFGCSSNEEKKKTTEPISISEPNEDTTAREPVTFKRPGINLPSSVLADYQRVKKKFKYIPFLCITQDGNLFITSNQPFNIEDFDDKKKKPLSIFGLINEKGDTLLKNEYLSIGNPGLFSDGMIEVKNKDGFRLYDYLNKRFIGETYDMIFPSSIMGYLAIGKKNNSYFKMYDDGTVRKLEDEKYFPTYRSIGKHLNIDTRSEDFGLWINTNLFTAEYPESEYAGLFITPSFIRKLGIMSDYITGITLEGSENGIDDLHTSDVQLRKRNKETNTIVYSFVEQGIEGRGWRTEEQNVVTVDKQNKTRQKRKINSTSDYVQQNSCENCKFSGTRFINDSILEVRYWVYEDNEFAKKGMNSLFVAMTQFSYFSIESNGNIKPIHEGSLFPMASIIPLNQSNLEGCFLKNHDQYPNFYSIPVKEDYDWDEDESLQWVAEFNQLTSEDIRYMINEIYARHGYLFSDKKWQNYFNAQSWYKGRSGNVDSKLTTIEKQNIYFLQSIEKQLKGNEIEQLQPKRKLLVWAG